MSEGRGGGASEGSGPQVEFHTATNSTGGGSGMGGSCSTTLSEQSAGVISVNVTIKRVFPIGNDRGRGSSHWHDFRGRRMLCFQHSYDVSDET